MGGLHIDIDEWGFDRESYGLVRTPGDLVIGDVPETLEENYSNAKMQHILNKIEDHRRNQKYHPEAKDYYERKIAFAEAELTPYRRRQNNEKPPYDSFIQFSILAKTESFLFEPKCKRYVRIPYNKPLYHAMKYFMNFVFEGRNTAIQVKCLELGNRHQIIRLPEGIKFNIQQLKGLAQNIEEYSKGLTPALDQNCHYSLHGDLAKVNEVNSNFEEVTFGYISSNEDPLQDIFTWPYLKMNFFNQLHRYRNDEFTTLISNLREMDKRVGTTLRFGFKTAEDTMELFNFIAGHFTTGIENMTLNVSLNNSKQLHISYQLDIEYMCYEAIGPPCILTMEVMAHKETDNE